MKKSQLYDRAEGLYTEDFWTFERIAQELACSDRTLRNWAKEGRWDEKRINFKGQQERLSDETREIALLLASKIKGQLTDEIEPSPHVLNAFTRMAASLIRVRDYDNAIDQQNAPTDDAGMRTATNATFKQTFGVPLYDDQL